jgi:hypothetical protein
LKSIKTFLRWCVGRAIIEQSPADDVPMPARLMPSPYLNRLRSELHGQRRDALPFRMAGSVTVCRYFGRYREYIGQHRDDWRWSRMTQLRQFTSSQHRQMTHCGIGACWSGCRVGLAPTVERCLVMAHNALTSLRRVIPSHVVRDPPAAMQRVCSDRSSN